jgi:hypothetical protein
MKTTTLLLLAVGLLTACNNNSATAEKKDDSKDVKVAGVSTEEKVDLPYKVESGGNWQAGSKQNLKVALDALRSWETKDFDAMIKNFGDSVELRFDAYEKKVAKAGVKESLSAQRNAYRDVQIVMNDYESVTSPDGKEQWVSLWYKQKFQDMGSKWDSISVMDDIRIKDGKIVVLDEKTRHFAKKN